MSSHHNGYPALRFAIARNGQHLYKVNIFLSIKFRNEPLLIPESDENKVQRKSKGS